MERAGDEAAGRYRARLDAAREKAAGATEERDQAVKERDEAKGERDDALRERDEALRKRDQALVKRADALGKLITAHEAGRVVGLSLQALKDLEHRVQLEAEALGFQRAFPEIGPANVKGIEINPYAAELARVSVWIGEIRARRTPPPKGRERGYADQMPSDADDATHPFPEVQQAL